MDRSDFLEALFAACRDLRGYFAPRGRQWLTNIVATGFDPDTDDHEGRHLKIDRIYELMVYFALLHALDANVLLHYRRGRGNYGFRLPYGPAKKPNYAYFRFEHEGLIYDLCNGTAIPAEVAGEPAEHPDIALQLREQLDDDDAPGTALAFWDAKHHARGELTKGDISQMFFWCMRYTLLPYAANDILDQVFPAQFKVSGVITNAPGRPQYNHALLDAGFSVVLQFEGIGTGEAPDPSRVDHLQFAPVGQP